MFRHRENLFETCCSSGRESNIYVDVILYPLSPWLAFSSLSPLSHCFYLNLSRSLLLSQLFCHSLFLYAQPSYFTFTFSISTPFFNVFLIFNFSAFYFSSLIFLYPTFFSLIFLLALYFAIDSIFWQIDYFFWIVTKL